jgi:hypothetical protein
VSAREFPLRQYRTREALRKLKVIPGADDVSDVEDEVETGLSTRATSSTLASELHVSKKRKIIEEYIQEEGKPRRLVATRSVTLLDLTEE